ncbi:Asg1-like protein [Cladobotryum mycophilum]|uniref:Asg1-like protein n=1 Tax=Cladobotryum mycophilum TaxID=491253 RepID=A0ABR0T3P5_9HYPO
MPPAGQERIRRRKISLACEPCRERKSRCDGVKPICSTCQRRSLGLERCVYKLDNARTASTDEYIKVLHDRIRRLEQVCTDNNVDIPPLDPGLTATEEDKEAPARWTVESLRLSTHGRGSSSSHVFNMLDTQPSNLDPRLGQLSTTTLSSIETPPSSSSYLDMSARESTLAFHPSPNSHSTGSGMQARTSIDPNEPSSGSVTAMGTVTAEDDVSSAEDFYGSSSAASFLKEAFESMRLPQSRTLGSIQESVFGPSAPRDNLQQGRRDPAYYVQAQNYSLPPRDLADHLLDRYRQNVYYLFPYFHLPSFESAYQSLWQSNSEPTSPSPYNLGLGCTQEGDATTIVFHCALNAMFSHACHFSDLPPADRIIASQTFFLRAKAFIGLDLLEANNLAVVQTLLTIALSLQATPYPISCWNSTGVACRVAQGLGLHIEHRQDSKQPIEKEIRRRVWYGCVLMDLYVFWFPGYNAPTLLIALISTREHDVWPPRHGDNGLADTATFLGRGVILGFHPGGRHSIHGVKFRFFPEHIRLCAILEEILSQVYQPWLNRRGSDPTQASKNTKAYKSLDAIIGLHTKLSKFESSLPKELCWKKQVILDSLTPEDATILETQKTVLRARFIYIRIMLLRPLLTQLVVDERERATSGESEPDPLVASTRVQCAKSCVAAASELLELIHRTYQSHSRGGWWWDALYACTSGLVLIVARTSSTLHPTLDREQIETSWSHCQDILGQVASFSESGEQSLKLLQTIYSRVCSASPDCKEDNPPPSPEEGISTDIANAILHSMPLDINTDLNFSGAGLQNFGNMEMMGSLFNLDTTLFGNPGEFG